MGWLQDLSEFATDPDVLATADKFITTPQEAQQMEYEKRKADLELDILEQQLKQQIKNQQPSNTDYVSDEGRQDPIKNTGSSLFEDKYLILGGGILLTVVLLGNR